MVTTREKNNKGLEVLHREENSVYLEAYQFEIEKNLYLFCYLCFPGEVDIDGIDGNSRKWLACFLNEKRIIVGQTESEGFIGGKKFFILNTNPKDLGKEEIALYLLREYGA